MKNLKQPGIWLVIRQRILFKERYKIFNCDILNRSCFIIQVFRLFNFPFFKRLVLTGKYKLLISLIKR